ncbi:MAG: condensation domain-containing protein, partial [Sulfurovum sp.]|nr:condensation domain-containing protein [Sulfurovum sp.]
SKEYVAPRNETEEKLAKIFQEVLNVERVGIYDNFFELGGHSLLATQLVSRIRSELEIELPLRELFATPMIETLSTYLQSHGEESVLSKIPVIKDRDNLQLSYAQERLWFLDKFEGGNSITYHMPAILKLEGSLNKEALHQALITIVERHEALRTNFVEKDEEALQIIREVDTFALEEIRCKESSVETKIKETLSQSFNLENDMLFKAALYTINKQTHYLLVNMHHIISDGWSIGILVREFVTLYNAYSNKQENPLQPLEIQYADYAAWQKEYLSGEVLEEKLNYWKETLRGIEPLALATTYPRPAIQSNRGNHISFSINKEITKKLNTLSNKYDTTLFMTLLSSFGLLLHRYSGQEEFIIGSPIANRNRFEIEPLIGFFVNTLALKQDFSSDMKFSTVLQQTKEHTLSAYDHQDVPFEKIVDALDTPRDTSRSPLFQVMFVLQNNPENTTLELPELKIEGVAFENPTSKFDLTMNITEVDEELHGSLEYATDLFGQTYIESMIEHFKILLEAIVKDETQAISKYPILTKQEEQQLLIEYNDTKVDYPKEKTIHQLFEAQVKLNPENVAVVYEDEELTYKQLNTKSNQLAHYLIEQGVEPDSLVAICVDRSLDMMIGLLAILKAGGAYVPIDPSYPEDRIKHMLDDSKAKLLLTQAHLKDTLPKTTSKTIAIDTLDTSKEKTTNPKTKVTSSNLAYVIYTSGSTGLPKGVMVEHRGVIRLVNKQTFINFNNIVILQVSTISFDAATFEIYTPLLSGGKLILYPLLIIDSAEINKIIYKMNINCIWLTAALFEQWAFNLKDNIEGLKYLLVGGDVVNPKAVEYCYLQYKDIKIINGYGPTESTTFATTFEIPERVDISSSPPIGRPINNTQLYILDTHLNLVPKGVVGELHIAGDG